MLMRQLWVACVAGSLCADMCSSSYLHRDKLNSCHYAKQYLPFFTYKPMQALTTFPVESPLLELYCRYKCEPGTVLSLPSDCPRVSFQSEIAVILPWKTATPLETSTDVFGHSYTDICSEYKSTKAQCRLCSAANSSYRFMCNIIKILMFCCG